MAFASLKTVQWKHVDLVCLSVLEGYFDLMYYRYDCTKGRHVTKWVKELIRKVNSYCCSQGSLVINCESTVRREVTFWCLTSFSTKMNLLQAFDCFYQHLWIVCRSWCACGLCVFMVRNGNLSQWQYFHFLYLPCTHWLLSRQEHSSYDMALCLLYSCAAVTKVPLMLGSQGQPVTDQCSWRMFSHGQRQLRPATLPVSLKFTAQALMWDCYSLKLSLFTNCLQHALKPLNSVILYCTSGLSSVQFH